MLAPYFIPYGPPLDILPKEFAKLLLPLPLYTKRDPSILPDGYTIPVAHSPSHSILRQFLHRPYAPLSIRKLIVNLGNALNVVPILQGRPN
ncbi:hypothetical protein EPI10_005091 [Gossypium australe]|uniref:Uncharacterized protein n=1 Tax=Gossypium australe TaxID=47621 RepID=A0A5B6WM11_9ROSI|nr:hypothetical protein EPI10_005091 [Gossypium australe]